jgi:hypothetical protein
MVQKYSKRLVKVFHFIVVCFKKLMIGALVLALGTAMLSAYSLIDFINLMADSYKGNPGGGSAIILILLAVPTLSYALEKGLNLYLQRK